MENNIEELEKFSEHLDDTANEMFDKLLNEEPYDNKYDVIIKCNGKELTLELNADIFTNLIGLIHNEIRYYKNL